MKAKRFFSIFTAILLSLFSLCGCGLNGISFQSKSAKKADGTDSSVQAIPQADVQVTDTQNTPLPKDKTYSILFIGNSYTFYNHMPESLFYAMAKRKGYDIEVSRITNGGHSLEQFSRPTDAYGKRVAAELDPSNYGAYDYVILQQQSLAPARDDKASFYDSVRILAERIRGIGAQPILYSTWGRHSDSADLAANGWTNESMTWRLAATYQAIGDELNIPVAHVGLAFRDVYLNHPEINLYDPDLTHPSHYGSYLAAMTIFSKIFGVNPFTVNFQGCMSVQESDVLKRAAESAVFATPEIPEEYRQVSEGVKTDIVYIDASQTQNLIELPKNSELISVVTSKSSVNGWSQSADGTYYFSGIRGDSNRIASTEYSTDPNAPLTPQQKADIADVRNGVSVIGAEYMLTSANTSGRETAIENLVNGHWGYTKMAAIAFDEHKYNVNGTVDENGMYRALITLNFGQRCEFDALGFASGDLNGFPSIAEVFVSDDASTWTRVPTACWDSLYQHEIVSCTDATSLKDPFNNNTPGVVCLFDMNGATGKYVRIGVVSGRRSAGDENSINTREVLVYGNVIKDASVLFVGNSFTYFNDMPTALFKEIAKSAGKSVDVDSITNGGHTLKSFSSPADTYGAKVAQALDESNAGKYDYVILQEQSSTPAKDAGRPNFYDAVRNLSERIRAVGATPILYSTWGHHDNASVPIEMGWSNEVMAWRLAAAYEAIGKELNISVAPVGHAFLDVYQGTSGINLYANDLYHPSYEGSYLAALTMFAKIFDVDPTTVAWNGTLSAQTAAVLKQAAKQAVFSTPATPVEYVTQSEGVTNLVDNGVDTTKTVNLKTLPSDELITIVKSNTQVSSSWRLSKDGSYYFSGLVGDSGLVAPSYYATSASSPLSAKQKAEFADIRNGVSIIGIDYMLSGSAGYQTSVLNLINGHWGVSYMAAIAFDQSKYDVYGQASATGKYRSLITLNFTTKHTFSAYGFASGNMDGFPQVADVYVSDDGQSWTLVPSACWDKVNDTSIGVCSNASSLKDPYNNNTTSTVCLFDMAGVSGKYVRLGIITGRTGEDANSINTREILVFGSRNA